MPIRSARPGESDALTALALASKAYWGYDEAFMEKVKGELVLTEESIGADLVFVEAEESSPPRGFYSFADPDGRSVGLDMLFVAPGDIGRGVGGRLLLHARETARQRGWSVLLIESDPFAAGFYEHAGARLLGVKRSWSTGRDLPYYELAT